METRVLLEDLEFIFVVQISTFILYIWECTVLNIKNMIFGSFSVKLIFKRPKKVGRCWYVGSDKERPEGRVGEVRQCKGRSGP